MKLPLLTLITATTLAAQAPLLTLEQAREMALKNHPILAALDFNARATAEQPGQIKSALAPQVAAGLSGMGADNSSRFVFAGLTSPLLVSRLGGGVQLNQLISDFGRTRLLADSASSRADAQKQLVFASRLQVLLAVDRAYYSILRARELTRVARQTVEARQLVVDQVTALTQSQLRSTVDLSFAKVNLAEAQLLLNRANNEREAAEADLALALGLGEARNFEVEDRPINEKLPPEAEPLVQRAIAERPELRQLALEIEANAKLLSAEKKLARPTITAQAITGLVSPNPNDFKNRYAAAGVNVSIPVFNGHLFERRQAEVALRSRALEKQKEDRANQIARDVRTAWLNARNAFDRIRLTEELLAQSQLNLDLAQSRYELGLGTIVELSQAQLNKTAAEVTSANARYEYQILRSALRYTLGEGAL